MAFFTAMALPSLGVSLLGGGPRFLLAREGFITGPAGVWFLISAWSARSLALVFSHPLLERLFGFAPGRWDGLWEKKLRFRRIWRISSVVGAGLLADASGRVVIAYTLPVDLVPALGAVLCAATSVLLMVIVNVYQARSGLWIMLRVGPRSPANPMVRRLLYPVHSTVRPGRPRTPGTPARGPSRRHAKR